MGNAANLRRFDYNCVWNSIDHGYVDAVMIDPQLAYSDKKVGSLGKVILGAWGDAGDPIVEVELREITRTLLEKMAYWFAGSAGQAVKLSPPAGVDIYTYAQLLTLHPTDIAGGTTSQDVTLLKAVPIWGMKLTVNGENDAVYKMRFRGFPDRSGLPTVDYGSITA